jgi:hypothetical protein
MTNKHTKSFLILAIMLAILLAACGGNETAAPDQPDISYVPYSDEELGVALVHPESWVTAGGFGGLTVASSQEVIDGDTLADIGDNGFVLVIPGELGIFNQQTGQSYTEADTLQILAVYKQLLEREGQTHLGVEPPQELTIEGQPAAMMVTRSEEENQNLITILAVVAHDDYMALVSAASLEQASADMRPIFEHIINSIQLTNPYSAE